MTPFEEQLKQALKREEPPGDFAATVMARCAQEDAKMQGRFWAAGWRVAALAAALVLVASGTVYEHHAREVQQEIKGKEAKRQLLLAMRIAGTKLQEVQQRVKESEQVEQ